MNQVSPLFRRCVTKEGAIGYGHYCPGCDEVHIIWTAGRNVQWAFNQDLIKPTFSPSVHYFEPEHMDEGVKIPQKTLCHYHIIDGEIRFCNDCDHALSGQNVPLPSLPDRFADDKYGWPGTIS